MEVRPWQRIATRLRRSYGDAATAVVAIDRRVELFFTKSVVGATFGICLITVSRGISPRTTSAFYETTATVCATTLVAVAIDSRNIAPSTLKAPRQAAGLLLGISVGLLIAIVASLTAIGIGRGTPAVFGLTVGAAGMAIFLLLVAVIARAANSGLGAADETDE